MKKIKAQKIIFKGLDSDRNEKFSWVGEVSEYNEDGNLLKTIKYDESGNIFESAESTYQGDLLINEVYDCVDEGTSTVTVHTYDDEGRNIETAIQYTHYRELQKFEHGTEFTTVRFEDEDGVLESVQKLWYDSADRIVKAEFYNEQMELEESEEKEFNAEGKLLRIKQVNHLMDSWTEQSFEYNNFGERAVGYIATNEAPKKQSITFVYDEKYRLEKVTDIGFEETVFDYVNENEWTETTYDLTQGNLVKAHSQFLKDEQGEIVKVESSHNIRSMAVDMLSAMKEGIVLFVYEFHNEYYA